MRDLCILICGSNRTGKTTTAKALLDSYGGTGESPLRGVTLNGDCSVAYIGADSTHTTTAVIPKMIEALPDSVDTVIVEGMYCGTFGIRVQDILFAARKQLIVFLYMPVGTFFVREQLRPRAKRTSEKVIVQQRAVLNAVRRWSGVGVPVISFDTSATPPDGIVRGIRDLIQKIDSKRQ